MYIRRIKHCNTADFKITGNIFTYVMWKFTSYKLKVTNIYQIYYKLALLPACILIAYVMKNEQGLGTNSVTSLLLIRLLNVSSSWQSFGLWQWALFQISVSDLRAQGQARDSSSLAATLYWEERNFWLYGQKPDSVLLSGLEIRSWHYLLK